ncbi:NADH:flavin oxidoreductase/NADH oxidase family protein [Sinobaca sp. H24]|uniref:NADH:flavin oxidoreductase/NADH oxidase family protein n=1 Tax=Sinobaca sp. H24 TaxID=2923376 RepID=UPI002079DC79|nr:NADH:flavin oxidoreductase/NADH oxidase family protein [Sinobaca sp. H24]
MTAVTINQPFWIKQAVFKNRLVKSAMSEAMAGKNHLPTDKLCTLYETWAKGGSGLVITGNVMVDAKALGEPGNVVLDSPDHLDAFQTWAEAGTKHNTQLWMQINHPGKQVIKGVAEEAVAPSAVPFEPALQRFFPMCRALEESEILEIIRKFARTAELAKQAGFTGVQIHAAHGYLISQFLSPRHNERTDQWGGPIENRFRFLREIYKAAREKTGPDFPIGVKINSSDFMKAGFSEEESRYVIRELDRLGVDLIEISGGTYERPEMTGKGVRASTAEREAYFLEYAEALKQQTDVPLIVTGGFRTLQGMNEALQKHATDFIGLARPLAVYPDYANQLLLGRTSDFSIKPIKTGIGFIDSKGILELTWYAQQLHRLGSGGRTKPSFSPLLSLGLTLWKNGKGVLEQRRA